MAKVLNKILSGVKAWATLVAIFVSIISTVGFIYAITKANSIESTTNLAMLTANNAEVKCANLSGLIKGQHITDIEQNRAINQLREIINETAN